MSIVQIINVIAGLMYYESYEQNSPNGNVLHGPASNLNYTHHLMTAKASK